MHWNLRWVWLSALMGCSWVGVGELPGEAQPIRVYSAPRSSAVPLAGPKAYQVIDRTTAVNAQTLIQLAAGRSTSLDFSPTKERIIFVNLADPSRVVYKSNFPIGQATTLFLTPIQRLEFPGATTTPITNLQVQTMDQAGNLRLYSFNLNHDGVAPYMGVVIAPNQRPKRRSPVRTTRRSPQQVLNINTIERGLAVALAKGYTAPTDPIVGQVRTVITKTRQGQPIHSAAQSVKVPLRVLEALMELGLREPVVPPTSPSIPLLDSNLAPKGMTSNVIRL